MKKIEFSDKNWIDSMRNIIELLIRKTIIMLNNIIKHQGKVVMDRRELLISDNQKRWEFLIIMLKEIIMFQEITLILAITTKLEPVHSKIIISVILIILTPRLKQLTNNPITNKEWVGIPQHNIKTEVIIQDIRIKWQLHPILKQVNLKDRMSFTQILICPEKNWVKSVKSLDKIGRRWFRCLENNYIYYIYILKLNPCTKRQF